MAHLLNGIVILAVCILMFLSAGCSGRSVGVQRVNATRPAGMPNIVLILTDDQHEDTLQDMPILTEELIENGVNFTNGVVTVPVCSPSRASVLTGRHAHYHGVRDNRLPEGGAHVFEDASTVATWLQASGYRTALYGKYLNDYDGLEPEGYIPPGWEEWFAFFRGTRPHRFYLEYSMSDNGEIVEFGTDDEDYSADVIARRAAEFIEVSENVPFFLVTSFYNPHQPHEAARRHNQLFRDDAEFKSRLRPNFNEEDVSDKPAWLQAQPRLGLEEIEYNIGVYQRSSRALQAVDEAIGTIVQALEDIGQRENTMIIFMGDNGLTFGEHRLSAQKNCGYEECIGVPFVISYPALVPAARVEDQVVGNIDLAPTIAELAGAQIEGDVDGVSLVPLLRDPDSEWREGILIEHLALEEGFGSLIPDYVGIRTVGWKYIEYITGEIELYDLVNDPYEMDNLAGNPEYQDRLDELAAQLAELKP